MNKDTQPSESYDNFDRYSEVNELFLDALARECNPYSEDSAVHAKAQWEHTTPEAREIFTIIAKKRYPDDIEAQETFVRTVMLTEFSRHVLSHMQQTIDEIRTADETPEEPIRIFVPTNS